MINDTSQSISKLVISLALVIIFLQPVLAYSDQGMGSIEINVKYTNLDRADYYSMSVKVYQDFSTVPYKEISSLSGNPYDISSLPIGHKYKIEVYSNDMYANTGYVDLQSSHETLDMVIPLSGGIRFNVFYNDGVTPIQDAVVSLESQDKKQWGQSNTDNGGQTTRFWIQPTTVPEDYYVADVSLGEGLVYSYSPVKVSTGISQEFKITTPWPTIISNLLTVQVFEESSKVVTTLDGNFLVELYDANGNKISDSKVDARGQAYFSNLKVGDYVFRAKNLNTNLEFGSKKMAIDGNQTLVQIIKNQTQQSVPNIHIIQPLNVTKSPNQSHNPNCQCVVFRLDNVQDYWLDNVQTSIIDAFQGKNASLTIGIIGNSFGSDTKLVEFIKDKIKTKNFSIELANNGWDFENYSELDENKQSSLLKKSNDRISSLFGIAPSVFIPPQGQTNENTLLAMSKNKMSLLSANTLPSHTDVPLLNTIKVFPATVATGFTSTDTGALHRLTNNEIFTNIENSLHEYGFAVVSISFQDYAKNNGTAAQNQVDSQQIQQLEDLIDKVHTSGIKIVTIGEINNVKKTIQIPSWIKNNAEWWSNGKISDPDFISGIQYMIQNHIIIIQNLPQSQESGSQSVPSWVKNNAGWWAEDKISVNDFVKGVEFLVQQGIIRI